METSPISIGPMYAVVQSNWNNKRLVVLACYLISHCYQIFFKASFPYRFPPRRVKHTHVPDRQRDLSTSASKAGRTVCR